MMVEREILDIGAAVDKMIEERIGRRFDVNLNDNDFISRSDAVEFAKHARNKGLDIMEYLEEVPAADVRPVVRGKWEKFNGRAYAIDADRTQSEIGLRMHTCSVCKKPSIDAFFTNFCPNCGADMREG